MPILLKTPAEIETMRRASQIAVKTITAMVRAAGPGVTTLKLDHIAADTLAAHGATSALKNYPTYMPGQGYPRHTCISVNDQVCNGVPGPRGLREGDILSLGVVAKTGGFCGSRTMMLGIGKISNDAAHLIDVADEALAIAIDEVRPTRKWSEIARMIQSHVESNGMGVVREFVGHGIGRQMLEDPKVCNFVSSEVVRGDFALRPGMTITIQPMITLGRRELMQRDDGFTVATQDGKPAAHVTHTIAVTQSGADVLTAGTIA